MLQDPPLLSQHPGAPRPRYGILYLMYSSAGLLSEQSPRGTLYPGSHREYPVAYTLSSKTTQKLTTRTSNSLSSMGRHQKQDHTARHSHTPPHLLIPRRRRGRWVVRLEKGHEVAEQTRESFPLGARCHSLRGRPAGRWR